MLDNYDSELTPLWRMYSHNTPGLGISYDNCSLNVLMKYYDEKLKKLEEWRMQEPGRKRSEKSRRSYQVWIDISHDLLADLNAVAEAIRKNKNGEPGNTIMEVLKF